MNHYIRIDENNNIVKTFCDVFEQPEITDVLYKENTEERHFNLQIFVRNQYKYRWDGEKIIEKKQQEIDAEITAWKNDTENKIAKVKEIRLKMLNMANWINGMKTAQDYGHAKGINKKTKIIDDPLMNQWAIWFEDMTFWFEDTDISTIDYDDIYINSPVFPIMPKFPDSIM